MKRDFQLVHTALITRRHFLLCAAGCAGLASIGSGYSQDQSRLPRIGYVSGRGSPTPTNPDSTGMAFSQELQRLGLIDGKNIRIEYRYLEGDAGRASSVVRELVQLKSDVIVTPASAAIRAAQ